MSSELMQARPIVAENIERALIEGRLEDLTTADRLVYFNQLCESLNLNPLTKPFEYIKLNGKLTLYANKGCAEQIRRNLGISITKMESAVFDDIVTYTVYGEAKDGHRDSASASVSIGGLRGEAKANAFMKAETKAKRRLTLSMGGLGMLDETEVESIPLSQKEVIREPVHALPEEPLYRLTVDEYTLQMDSCETLDELKKVYVKAMKVYKGDDDSIVDLTDAKDKRKSEIEADDSVHIIDS